MVLAHRYSYEFHVGPIPSGLCVCHSCDNRRCVNPKHLFLGTNADNVADREKKERGNGGGLPGEDCGRAKLKTDQVLAILADRRPSTVVANELGIAGTTVRNIRTGRTWKHVRTLGLWKEDEKK